MKPPLLTRLAASLIAVAASVQAAHAANVIPEPGSVDSGAPVQQVGFHNLNDNSFKPDSLENILNAGLGRITNAFVAALGGVAVIFLIYSGIQYITSGGDSAKAKTARQNIINISLGIILLITTYTILGLIVGTVQWLANVV